LSVGSQIPDNDEAVVVVEVEDEVVVDKVEDGVVVAGLEDEVVVTVTVVPESTELVVEV
jgi:hypothetical protein